MPAHLADLEQRIGHRFADRALLQEALTHSSAKRRGRHGKRSNQRLEFLGDRVLGLVIADLLVARFRDEAEGALSRRHAALVRRESLAEIGRALGLGEWLVVARSEEEGGGRTNPSILADALEAVIGALYLDGGLPVAVEFITTRWRDALAGMGEPPRDPKTALQEWAQAHGLGLPRYDVAGSEGPAHAPRFHVTIVLGDLPAVSASAGSKRAAEQAAAAALLAQLEPLGDAADG